MIYMFAKDGKKYGQNQILWGFYGLLSYMIPVFIFSWIIFPFVVSLFTNEPPIFLTFLRIILSIGIGLTSCDIIGDQLKKQYKTEKQDNNKR